MQHSFKLVLTVVCGGVLFGAALSKMSDPAMQFANQPDWRDRYHTTYSDTAMQFVDVGPIDLSPPLPWTGLRPAFRDADFYGPYYRSDETPDLDPLYDIGELSPSAVSSVLPAPSETVQEAVDEAAATADRLDAAAAPASRPNRMNLPDASEAAEQSANVSANVL